MSEHVNEWLNAYLDGELRGLRLRQVEAHLDQCAACRLELAGLRQLSTLLQETAPAESFTPTERFVANLTLRLGAQKGRIGSRPRSAAPSRLSAIEVAWWLVPVAVLGAWIFIKTVFSVSNLVTAADETGLLGNAAAWLQDGSQQALWFSASMNLFGNYVSGNGLTVLDVLNGLSIVESSFWTQVAWQAGIGFVLCGWLAGWWNRYRAGRHSSTTQSMLHS
jgi:hypothetical protein